MTLRASFWPDEACALLSAKSTAAEPENALQRATSRSHGLPA